MRPRIADQDIVLIPDSACQVCGRNRLFTMEARSVFPPQCDHAKI